MPFLRDLSVSAASAGFVAVLVGFTSSVALVFQAAQAFGASEAVVASWMWALGIGMGLTTALPSLLLRKPVMIAWSTPGAAVLASAGVGFDLAQATGAFIVCALLITLAGATGWFERVMNRIPMAIAAGLLAGVLANFGMAAFSAAQTALPLVLLMLATYLLGRRWLPRYAVPLTLAASIAFAAAEGTIAWSQVQWEWARPVWTTPRFTWQAAVSVALPLFVVTMASQNVPGVAVMRATGYRLPVSRLITLSGLATLVLAPFGGYTFNLAAITAALCMGPEAHPDPARRYASAVVCGLIYVLVGLFGAAVAGLLIAFPQELVAAIAGLALLSTIGGGLVAALQAEAHREPALITFLVTASGLTLGGIGAAFWGVVAGSIALAVAGLGRKSAAGPAAS